MSSSSEAPLKESSRRVSADAAPRDWQRLLGASSLEEFAAGWLALAGGRTRAARGVLVVRKPDSERYAPIAFFPEGEPCGSFLADVAERALAESRPAVVEGDGGGLGIAIPVECGRRLEAIAALEWTTPVPESRDDLLRELRWATPWIERRLARAAGDAVPGRDAPLVEMVRRVAAAARFEDGARAAATDLAIAFGCERVSVGVADGGRTRLAALSHAAQFDPRLALPRALEAAIAEACLAGKPLLHPAGDGQAASKALAALAQEGDGGCILCFPCGVIGFCFERREAFNDEALRDIGSACTLLAALLDLQRVTQEPLARRAWSRAKAHAGHWFGPRAGRRRVVAASLVFVLAVLAFAEGEFRVAGDAVLEGSVRRVITAPFDGYVASAHARAGDVVKQGAPVAALDDRDLRLDRVRVASQHAQYARQIQEAAAKHDRGQMQILQAQVAQAEAQLQLLDEQLKRARLAAPFDGLVVSGDLSQTIGGAVKKGETLFEVAPLSGYRVVVQVDEGEIASVEAGQKGTLLLAAITDRSFAFTVTVVTPVARAREGRNTFRVEAALEGAPERLRPGMEGVAKIETGPRKLVWIWTHRFTNWLRLTLWSLWP